MPANIGQDGKMSNGKVTNDKVSDANRSELKLYYRANQIPSPPTAILFGFQQLMVCVSGLLVTPYILSNTACAGAATALIRVKLISTTLVVAGLSTLLQNTLGVRLALLQGPSFAYLPPIFAFSNLPEFKCNVSAHEEVPEEDYLLRLRIMQGSLVAASALQIFIGMTGFIGLITKFIGPLTIAPLMLLLMLSVVGTIVDHAEQHILSLVQVSVLLLVAVYLARVKVPLPVIKKRRISFKALPIFTLFPYLLAIGVCWLISYIITATGWERPGGAARTDKPDSTAVLREAPWLRIPYPGQWGAFGFNTGVFLGFFAAALASLIESVGAYHACARISDERPPPAHAVNRGVLIEGVGVLLAGLFGSGVGVTTYSENIGVINITKVASRVTLQIAGLIMIVLGIFTKFGAVLATIPEPLVGGILCVSMSMVGGVGLSSMQLVNLKMSRNVAVLGFSIMAGMVIPLYFERHPLKTGLTELDNVLNIVLTIRMFVGGLIGFFMDNTVPGATRAQRGLHEHNDATADEANNAPDAYSFPSIVNKVLSKIPCTRFVPFLPNLHKPQRITPSEPPPVYNFSNTAPV
uniref:Solute carrier family 23 member 2 n=1 Tax=Plectus sambesii TaxID=2011161 RepID=A0A914WAV6_9BILA